MTLTEATKLLKTHLIASIRAYGAEERSLQESMKRINRYTTAGRVFYNLNRWVSLRLDVIGALFAAGLGAYLIYFQNLSASNVGFSLNMAGEQNSALYQIILLIYCSRVQRHDLVLGSKP